MYNKLKVKYINFVFYHVNHIGSYILPKLAFIIPQNPIVLHIRITTKCNLSCPFCYLKDGLNQDEYNHLSVNEWRKILSPLPRTTIIDITGSEPFMAKGFLDFLNLVIALGFKYSITTNGTLLNDGITQHLKKNNGGYYLISLDGLSTIHDGLRGVAGSFSKSTNFIKLLKSTHGNKTKRIINVKTMVLDENIDDIIPLLKYLESEIRPDILTLNLPFQNQARGGVKVEGQLNAPSFSEGNTHTFLNPKKIISTLNKIKKMQHKFRFPIIFKPDFKNCSIEDYIKSPSSTVAKSCSLYKNNITIYYDGSLTPCDINYHICNIRELNYDIKQLYTKTNFFAFKKTMGKYNKTCEGCMFTKQSLKKKKEDLTTG